jgi:hypothetical protein
MKQQAQIPRLSFMITFFRMKKAGKRSAALVLYCIARKVRVTHEFRGLNTVLNVTPGTLTTEEKSAVSSERE